MDWQPLWSEFASEVESRLETGAREYGDRSFRRSEREIEREIEEELFDVAGWSFIRWARLRALMEERTRGVPRAKSIAARTRWRHARRV